MKRLALLIGLLAASPAFAQNQPNSSAQLSVSTLSAIYSVNVPRDAASLGLSITGITGTGAVVTLQGTANNGISWATTSGSDASCAALSTITADQALIRVPVAGYTNIRLLVTTAGTGGPAAVTVRDSTAATVCSASGGGGGPVTNAGTFPVQDNGTAIIALSGAAGTTADTAWSGSGSSTIVSALKAIYAKVAGILITNRPDVASSGTINSGTLNAAYTLTMANGEATAAFTVTGLTASGATLAAEGSNDNGTTWSAVNTISPSTGTLTTTITTDQQFRINAAGRTRLRLRVSVTGTGTITVASNLSAATGEVSLSAQLPAGVNTIGNVGNRSYTQTALAVSTVTTGGTAVTAFNAGSVTAGGTITNPGNATTNLCYNQNGTAVSTNSYYGSGSTFCLVPGQSAGLWPSANAVSVIASDSGHIIVAQGAQ